MRRVLFLAILTLTWLPGTVRAAPIELPGTPRAARVELPITPDPATCDADSIDIDRLTDAASATKPTPTEVTETVYGRPATPELVDDLLRLVTASLACTNANQPLRALAFFTEDFLIHRIGNEPAVTLGHLQAASTRDPGVAAEADRVTLVSLYGHGVLDERPFLMIETASGGQSTYSILSFVESDENWLIDDVSVMTDGA